MAISIAYLYSVIFQALAISSTLSVLLTKTAAAHILGQAVCPSFSCGHLQNIQHPFRLRGDPPGCGVQEYELVCSGNLAIIHINMGRYFVTNISYSDSIFWVVDASLDNSSCPIPERNHHPYLYGLSSADMTLFYPEEGTWAAFVVCSQMIKDNVIYRPVDCQSTNSSFVYVLTSELSYLVRNVEPSCGYLAMTPLSSWRVWPTGNVGYDYEDVVKFMRKGFAVRFPIYAHDSTWTYSWIINRCLNDSVSNFHEQMSSSSIQNQTSAILGVDIHFLRCINYHYQTKLFWAAVVTVSAISIVKFIIVFAILSRLVFAPLSVLTFLAYKYWKTKIAVDTVEKFLQMQLALGPTRYAYTDITAITSHFRDKLGQGGYGTVYKGVLPGDVHVAIKMLVSSMSDGEEFISEVSSIGSIHHVNVVRLVGFCSEEMRRALVYEYMPNGSLEKYIFSSDKSFSWDKLNEIAVGIARGINYLHRGCDMQILHFDIKPHNILLDSDFTPKIADFGLAKLYPRDNSFLPVSAARGTVGYIAPEMISRSFGAISSKSDVYSFGMLLLEMAGGRRNADPQAPRSQTYYPAWVYNQLSRQEVGEISEARGIHEVEKKLCIVALWCIQMMSHDRPSMSEVLDMLEAGVDGLEIPPEPFFCGDEYAPDANSLHLPESTTFSE
ncbi:rust resistance kinase Lr10-like isoform X1 [Lolium rigidum]|uniref:rust resistance kinase Lr10-like isoform X1 n=1 Tax=Lolium rigidum TaxID=89674 RepID=UPI001F5C2EBC|nr:rust resistance kinase Lr10-like isoform X1 [Lolium rigidum]